MALRDQEKAPANLLRQSLRDSGDGCPGPDILAAYFERSLDRQQSARCELHLSQCARCREQLAALDRASAPAAAGAQPQPSAQGAWLWDWRWLAPVAAVLIVVAVWVARRPAPKQTGEPQHLVAMSQPQEVPTAPPAPEYARKENGSAPSGVPGAKPAPNLTNDLGPAGKPSPIATAPHILKRAKELTPPAPPSGQEVQTDSLERKDEKAARDFDMRGSNLTAPSTVSRTAASPAPPLPASEEGRAPATVAAEAETIGPQSSTSEVKGNPTSAAARVSAQRTKTDAGVSAQALAIEAVVRRSLGNIIVTPDPEVLWRIAEGGFVERSQDGGASWKGQLPDASAQLTAGSAPSQKVCWLVGRDGVIFLTSNAKDWRRIPPPVAADFVAITAQDVSTATVGTADGRKFTTADGGIHWNPAP